MENGEAKSKYASNRRGVASPTSSHFVPRSLRRPFPLVEPVAHVALEALVPSSLGPTWCGILLQVGQFQEVVTQMNRSCESFCSALCCELVRRCVI